MYTPVFNDMTNHEQAFEEALKDIYQSFKAIHNRPSRPEDYDSWREQVREKYPLDWKRLLVAVQQQLEAENRMSA